MSELLIRYLEFAGAALFMVFFLGFCIFIHELGHFLAAKWRGLHITAFSLGFRKIWAKKINGIEYRIGWLQFGGYVDLPQIDSSEPHPKTEDGTILPRAKPLDRMITAFAGPFFNILFGLALGCLVWYFGIPQDTPRMREIVVEAIDKNGPEYQAGLREGDQIVKFNGESFSCTWVEFIQKVIFSVGKVDLGVKRGNQYLTISFVPKPNPNLINEKLKREDVAYPFFLPRIPIELYPEPGSPAAKAGVVEGDTLISINGNKVLNFEQFQNYINLSEGKPIDILVKRKDGVIKVSGIVPIIDEDVPESEKNIYMIGISYLNDNSRKMIVINGVAEGFPAVAAGIKVGDQLLKMNGRPLDDVSRFRALITDNRDTPIVFTVKRGDKVFETKITPRHIRHYTIGIRLTIMDYPDPWQQFVKVVDMSYKSLRGIMAGLSNKMGLTESGSTLKPRNLSGPIGLGKTIFVSVYYGSFMLGIYFIVIISFALAIFNLLPLPVLDGGHVMLAAVEMVFRRPLHETANKIINYIFAFLLIALMIYVTVHDILREVPAEKLGFITDEKSDNGHPGDDTSTKKP